MVIVVAEGAGQEFVAQSMPAVDEKDASGNRLLLDIGLWLTQKIKVGYTISPTRLLVFDFSKQWDCILGRGLMKAFLSFITLCSRILSGGSCNT